MHLWVTRPQEDASVLRARLIAQGHDVFLEPLLVIEFDADEPIDLDGAQGLIATSKNGLRALAAREEEAAFARGLPVYAVGRGTAEAARALGFETVVQGPAAARELVDVIVETAPVNDGTLVHLSGADVAFDLCNELQHLGYHVAQPILYRARQVDRFSDGLLSNLITGRIEGVLLLSPRTAEVYVRLVEAHQILRTARKLTHFCLSRSVAARLASLQLDNVKLSRAPNIEEMLALTGVSAAQ